MSIFKQMFALAGNVIDTVYAEDFEVIPRSTPSVTVGGIRDVNARRVADTFRQPFTFSGSFVSVDEEFSAEGRGMGSNRTRAGVAPKPMIDVATALLAYLPREGDTILRVETGEMFDVAKEISDDVGRTTLHLAERQARA